MRGKRAFSQAAFATRRFAKTLLLCLALSFSLSVLPSTAFADDGLEVVGVSYTRGAQEKSVSPEPAEVWYASVQFSKNVSFANEGRDDAFIEENLSRVHLLTADGQPVERAVAQPGGSREERQLIYIATHEWLDPLTSYQIVIEPGIVAANGVDVTDKEYVFWFKTSDECPDGVSLYQKIIVPAALIFMALGVAVQVTRVVHRRR